MLELHMCSNAHASSLRHLAKPWDELHPPEDNIDPYCTVWNLDFEGLRLNIPRL